MAQQRLQHAVHWFLRTLDTHPLLLSTATVGAFTVTGLVSWTALEWLEGPFAPPAATTDSHMTLEEARVRAMIENARSSASWKDNLEKAASAQELFMLPGREHKTPEFMNSIDRRSLEIMKKHNDRVEERRRYQREADEGEESSAKSRRMPTTRIWKG